MMIRTNKIVFQEFVHWMWLWVLAAIVIAVLQQPARGTGTVHPLPLPCSITESENVTLGDILLLNERGDFQGAIDGWQQLDITRDSRTWKHVGIGVAQLRLDNLDQAEKQLMLAIEVDPENAVAEYFLGRVCQARSRKVPFWYEKDDASPFRLIVLASSGTVDEEKGGLEKGRMELRGAILPQYKTLPVDKQARQHFRRAIQLSGICRLDRPIEIVKPRVRLVRQPTGSDSITIRELLISLDEENYVEKARLEVQEQFVGYH